MTETPLPLYTIEIDGEAILIFDVKDWLRTWNWELPETSKVTCRPAAPDEMRELRAEAEPDEPVAPGVLLRQPGG